ncbi:fumarylacetoacetate hydrolase family protein [Rhabdaerophilum sp. SD176]|uniref:fumarylacetoacetate hydrolase family protein n=1 Tax=Rhabdaerophilum sp. SD176 TaxID=2983548 RepID=UPI0024DF9F38|nr:fumarylacetoacetate hydrolase family protein [Rhabdaerophilum sp. SD176]
MPHDAAKASLIGRVWLPDQDGPALVRVADNRLIDISRHAATSAQLCADSGLIARLSQLDGPDLGPLDSILLNTPEGTRDRNRPWLLPPIDLQAVKAAGVTFAISMLERVIEERARGDAGAAAAIRSEIVRLVGDDLSRLKPGSPEAMALKEVLIRQGVWSQYLEVGIGPDAEIFTKAQPMASVGTGMLAGLHRASTWNNPEPEVVLVVAPDGRIVGATLGNDVNLRDVEGRSALLLGKAKDNNASCALGPFIRLFDAGFTLDHVRKMELSLDVTGPDGFVMKGASNMAKISRDPADLASQMLGPHHQYPDGAVLFLGTLFAPVQDRGAPGKGFTHAYGDIVVVAAPELGALVNQMAPSDECPPWQFGTTALMRNLARRGLL